ncbi:MAG: phage head closure protein [Parvibaculum sp.]|nr:phage head closure protein [Parvibaculum sp.]
MSAGAMRERVTLQAPVRTPDGAGGADVTWNDVATVWASVMALSGRERPAGERMEARRRLQVLIRYRSDVTAAMRLVWQGRALDIRTMCDIDGKRHMLLIDCEEGGQ